MNLCPAPNVTLWFLDCPSNWGQTFAYAYGVGCKNCCGGSAADWVGTAGSCCWHQYCNDRTVDADVVDNYAGFGCSVAGKRPVGGEAASCYQN